MDGVPFHLTAVVNLEEGELIKEVRFSELSRDTLGIVECVGVNAFGQPGQELFVALQVTTNSEAGTYPIALTGHAPLSDPTYPFRTFGSQLVRLYADPNCAMIATVTRGDSSKGARVFLDLCGLAVGQRR